MVDRSKVESLVWKRTPADMKVRASDGTLLVKAPGTGLVPMATLAIETLFEVYRRLTIPLPTEVL